MTNTIQMDLDVLNTLKLDSGLFKAAGSDVYEYVWLRDNFYISLAYEAAGDTETVTKLWHGIFDILEDYEWKIDTIVSRGIKSSYEWIHPKYTIDGKESHAPWGNRQFDAIGAILTKLPFYIRDERDEEIVKKLVRALAAVKYYDRADHGIWEEQKVIHASSVGACVAGLIAVRDELEFEVPGLIAKGERRLLDLLPREIYQFDQGRTDLALLSLIYPYALVSPHIKDQILTQIKEDLLGKYGVARYTNDQYFSDGSEAQWSFGLPWLSLCTDDPSYLEIANTLRNKDGELAESYNTQGVGNDHCPLGWTHAMMIVANKYFASE